MAVLPKSIASLDLCLRAKSGNYIDHASLRSKGFDQGITFALRFLAKFGLCRRRSFLGQEVSSNFFGRTRLRGRFGIAVVANCGLSLCRWSGVNFATAVSISFLRYSCPTTRSGAASMRSRRSPSIGRSLYSAIQSPSGFTSVLWSAIRRIRYSLTKWSVTSEPFETWCTSLTPYMEKGQRLSRLRVDLAQDEKTDWIWSSSTFRACCRQPLPSWCSCAIARHHVEACGPTFIDIGRRVIEIAIKKPLDECLVEKSICPSTRGRYAALCWLARQPPPRHWRRCESPLVVAGRTKTASPSATKATGIVKNAKSHARFAFAVSAPSTS